MRQIHETLTVRTDGQGLHEITAELRQAVARAGLRSGLLTVYIHHSSASLLIQENADPDVQTDLQSFFRALVREDPALYRHRSEGPDDMPAHIRAALTQTHLGIPIADGRPDLGTWQGVFVFEHRARPHQRRLTLHMLGE